MEDDAEQIQDLVDAYKILTNEGVLDSFGHISVRVQTTTLPPPRKSATGALMVPNCLGVPGGVPVIYDGECLGGVGVSGIDLDDEPVARAGADAFAG